jgi:hypothetical protein
MVRKMKELLSLKQGDDTVYQYAQKFNSLCQYREHHVDTDAKKMERFRDGLRSELYERINLLEPNSYHELVNKAISQEDAMMKVQKEKKSIMNLLRELDQARNFVSSRRMGMVLPNHLHQAIGE